MARRLGYLRAVPVVLITLFLAASVQAAPDFCSVDEIAGHCASAAQPSPTWLPTPTSVATAKPVLLEVFYAHDCPHCHEALLWLPELERKYPNLVVQKYEVKANLENRRRFHQTAARHHTTVKGVPTFFLGDTSIVGFYKNQTCAALIEKVHALSGFTPDAECERSQEFSVPLLGTLKTHQVSLLNFTVILGLLDSLNPCAIWVLTFLLSILVYSKQRRRIALIGGTFVLASGLVYFAFMAAWLNLFVVIGMSRVITLVLAAVAICMGLINLKELFWFKQGVSLTIPDSAKPKIGARARGILQERSTAIAFVGTAVLAVFANFVELGCTVGFPAIYTKVLADREPSTAVRYAYMALYNTVYVVPLALIVGLFTATLGHFRLTEKHGKVLKLVSGAVMLALGLVMLLKPELLVVG
jgi:cytochrome c biogenesis protein CcdA/thiol-disulfide isomerase/thioredoxin